MRTQDKAMEQTSLEHIAHMLGTLTEDMNETFRQTHKVKELEGGNSIYAVVPMKSHIGGKDNLLFQLDVIDDTYLTVGERATVAIEAKALEAAGDSARAVVHTQNNQYMVAKSSKSGGHRVRGMTHSAYQNNQRNKGLRPTTNVSIPAGDKLEKLLISLLEGVIPDLSKIEGMKGQLEASTMGLVMGQGGRATGKFSKTERNTMFWALPYIGVLQSEYASQNQ
jgi:hypothetical protein